MDSMKQTGKLHIEIPAEVTQILETLHAHGYEAYVVGGCVRDALLCRAPGRLGYHHIRASSAGEGPVSSYRRYWDPARNGHGTEKR